MKGFTLVETVLSVFIIGVALFGLMHLFQGSVRTAADTDQAVQAASLARERLERILFDKKMNGYDFVTQANYPAVENFTGAFAPFTRTVAIREVRETDLTTDQANSGYKRVTVGVQWGANGHVTLETLATKWNE